MKELSYRLTQGGGYWSAMLRKEHSFAKELVSHMKNVWNNDTLIDVPLLHFDLMIQRTFTPDYQNYEGMSQEEATLRFDAEFPDGKPLLEEQSIEDAFSSILTWKNYSFIGPVFVDPPNLAHYRIISQELKDVLSSCHLPQHHFYPIELTQEMTKECRRYYVLHLRCHPQWAYKNCIWEECEPIIYNSKEQEVLRRCSKGEGGSFDVFFDEVFQPYKGDVYNMFKVDKFVFADEYDVIPVGTSLVISDALQQKLVAANLNQAVGQYLGDVKVYIKDT